MVYRPPPVRTPYGAGQVAQRAEHRGGGHEKTVQSLADHWQELKATEQQEAPAQGGMTGGGDGNDGERDGCGYGDRTG